MANKDSDFRSVTGQAETAEPAGSSSSNNNGSSSDGLSRKSASTTTNKSSQSSSAQPAPPAPILRKSSSSNLSLTPHISSPLAQSPRGSRNTSPIRKDKPQTAPSNLSIQPSAAAIQRALSASNVPQLQQQQQQQQQQNSSNNPDLTSRLPRGPKSAATSGDNTPQFPHSPRLKSPPPSGPNSRRGSAAATTQRRVEPAAAPSIQVLSATPQSTSPAPPSNRYANTDNTRPEPQLQPPPPPKTSSRGPSGKSMLETVQENTGDAQEPSPAAIQAAADLKPQSKAPEEAKAGRDARQDETKPAESGSESAENKSDNTNKRSRRPSTSATASHSVNNAQPVRPRNPSSKSSYAHSTTKSRTGDGKQNMTVETETVQSIPQSGLAPASESANRLRAADNGTVKLKPSNETIRPKKERKKNERKTRSVNQGSATSKADLFEARVANAVDEANTSDSDETFVYESNPPEPHRRQQRHHSRTPSVTSSHSVADQQRGGLRPFGDAFDERRVGGKRSMKFSSNPYNDVDAPESNNGTVRTHTPRHFGRYGRSGHHSATYDSQHESPFPQASKLRHNHLQRSRPTSPKSPQSMQFRPGGFFSGNKKQERPYDFDAEQNADDERTPLVGTVRTHRGARGVRRMGSNLAYPSNGYQEMRERWRWCSSRLGSFCLTMAVAALVITFAMIFIFASNRPLKKIEIRKIQNVLATEQELMLDLVVGAVNPNAWEITISDLDVNVFAKSKHVRAGHASRSVNSFPPDKKSRRKQRSDSADYNPNPSQDLSGHWHGPGDTENGDDVQEDTLTMLLGRVFRFDQPISFEASPVHQRMHYSSGQVRLMKPGNKTETGGSALWEKVIENPFELTVRGVLRYQLPISSRQQSVAVGASVTVHPEDGIDDKGSMRVEPIDHSDYWDWIDWPDLLDEDSLERGKAQETGT